MAKANITYASFNEFCLKTCKKTLTSCEEFCRLNQFYHNFGHGKKSSIKQKNPVILVKTEKQQALSPIQPSLIKLKSPSISVVVKRS